MTWDRREPDFSHWATLKDIKQERPEEPDCDNPGGRHYIHPEEARVCTDTEDSDVEEKGRVFGHCDGRLVKEFLYVTVLERYKEPL